MKENGRIVEDVTNKIRCDWVMWKEATAIFYDKKVLLKVKVKFYKILMYGTEVL